MRQPHRGTPNVTQDRLDAMLERSDASLVHAEAPRSNWASGDVGMHLVREGLAIHMAQLRGVAGFKADLMSVSGLSLEIRLEGQSSSTRASDGFGRHIGPGSFALSACETSELWHVTTPAQPAFRTLSIMFGRPVIDAVGDTDLTAFVAPMFETGQCAFGAASFSSLAQAEQILSTDLKAPFANAKLNALCMTLLSNCAMACHDAPVQTTNAQDDIVAEARNFITENAEKALAIADVAAHCGISPSSLKAPFARATGLSVGRYIRAVRMQTARDMLENGVPIANVTQLLNYSAPEALTRAFSKHFGVPPSQVCKV